MNLGRKPKPGEVTTMSSLPSMGTTGVTPPGPGGSAWPPQRAPDQRLSVGYIVAGAFFLVIASVGFGLWLALEVVAL